MLYEPVLTVKDYRDPLYGFVSVNEIEQKIIDTVYFQRLRNINQLETTFLLYPSAMHALATTHYVYTDVLKRKGHIEDDMLIDNVCALKPHLFSNDIIQAKNILTANNLF